MPASADLLGSFTVRAPVPASEVSVEFHQGMVNRMAVSHHKYGFLADNVDPNGPIDPIKCALQRIEEYERTGNTEFLMDAANFCMIRFIVPRDGDYFKATDSDGSPGLTTVDGVVTTTYTKEHRQ